VPNRYAKIAGGNWSSANTWSATSSADVDNAGVPTSSDDVIFDTGSATTGALVVDATAVCKTFTASVGATGTITHNAFNLTVSGNITFVSTMTYTPGSSGVLVMNVTGTLTTGGKLLCAFYSASGATVTLGDNVSFVASKNALFGVGITSPINLNGKTIAGNSTTNRLIISSATTGSQGTIVVAGGTFANADFQDITFNNGGSNLDLSAITGLSGDCGGNGMTGGGVLTFTTSADQHWVNDATGNWSDSTKWTSRIPLPQDNVFFDRSFTARTITMDMFRAGKTIDWSGASGTVTWGTSVSTTIYGSLDLTNLTTIQAIPFTLSGRGSFTIKSAGKTFGAALTISAPNGTYTLLDAFGTTGSINLTRGTFVDGGYNITATAFATSNSTTTRAVTKTGNWTLTRNTALGIINNSVATGLTWSDTSGTITGTGIPAAGVSILLSMGGQSYNNVVFSSTPTGGYSFETSGTIKNLTISAPNILTISASTTTTITNNIVCRGSEGKMVIINSPAQTTSSATPILNYTGTNIINTDYLQIQGVNVTPTQLWYYGYTQRGIGLDFKGQATSGDKVVIANSATANQIYQATSYSGEMWVYQRVASSVYRYIDKVDALTATKGFRFYNSSTNLNIGIVDAGWVKLTTSNAVTLANQLNHVVFTWVSGAAPKLYLNGSEVTYAASVAAITPVDDSATSLIIGNDVTAIRALNGIIYATRIYRNVALTSGNVTTLYNAGAKAINPLGNATSEYMFNEGTGSTLTDSVGGVNGTITTAGWTTNWTNKLGLSFRGQASSGDVVSVPDSATANQIYGATSYSWESWFIARSAGAGGLGSLFGKISGVAGFTLRLSSTLTFSFTIFDGTNKTTATSTAISLNTLNHVTVSWASNSYPNIYLNGVECPYASTASAVTPSDDTTLTLVLGNNTTTATRTFDGNILATRIYRNKALSLSDVQTAYYAGPNASLPVSGCTSEYLFNEGTGSTLTDSVNAVNGTISGALWANTGWNPTIALDSNATGMRGIW